MAVLSGPEAEQKMSATLRNRSFGIPQTFSTISGV